MKLKTLASATLFVGAFVCAQTAFAQGPAVDAASTTSSLEMSALVQTAVRLDISAGGAGTVGGNAETGAFTIDLGNVNGLGEGTPAAGVTATDVGTGFLYTSEIVLTPTYSGYGADTAVITVQATGTDSAIATESDSATFRNVAGAANAVATAAAAASGTPINRVVGFQVDRSKPAGALSATLTYTITPTP